MSTVDVAIKPDKKQVKAQKEREKKQAKEQAKAERIAKRRERIAKKKGQTGGDSETPAARSSFGTKSQLVRKQGSTGIVNPGAKAVAPKAATTTAATTTATATPPGRPSAAPVPSGGMITLSEADLEARVQAMVNERVAALEKQIRKQVEDEFHKAEEKRRAQEDMERQLQQNEEQRRQKLAIAQARAAAIEEHSAKSEEHIRKQVEEELRRELITSDDKELRNWDIDPKDLDIFGELGSGAFGVVLRGKLHGKDVAIKQMNMEDTEEDVLENFKKEVEIMVRLRHPNILLFMGASFKEDNLMLVTELMPKGSVDDMIHEKGLRLPFKQRVKIMRDCALGMNWLHKLKPPFLHLDLKTGNLLVDDNWNVKVADFGLSQIKGAQEGPVGSPFYMAPEMLMNKPYTERADIYSFGIVLWELLTQEEPYKDEFEDLEEFIEAIIVDGERPPIPDDCPPTLRDLLQRCYEANPKDRPSFQEMLEKHMFEAILIEGTISDPAGQEFWKQHFLERQEVLWTDFVEAYRAQHRMTKDHVDDSRPKIKALRRVMCGKDNVVSMDSFAAACLTFGPLSGFNLIDNVEKVCSQPWFHGNLAKQDAELLLANRKPGTFLVRFSETSPGAFSISVTGKNGITNYRITRDDKAQFVLKGVTYASLFECLKVKQLKLKQPCPGSGYASLWSTTANSDDYGGESTYGSV